MLYLFQGNTAGTVKCRWDWHQTPEYVIVSVYAKKYDPTLSFVKLNPIRLNTKLVFREEGDAVFELDLELRGVSIVMIYYYVDHAYMTSLWKNRIGKL